MAYAKSIGVAPTGRSTTSPFGVKTKTRREKKSSLSPSTNSLEPATAACASASSASQCGACEALSRGACPESGCGELWDFVLINEGMMPRIQEDESAVNRFFCVRSEEHTSEL